MTPWIALLRIVLDCTAYFVAGRAIGRWACRADAASPRTVLLLAWIAGCVLIAVTSWHI